MRILAILGATASGKTALSIEVAKKLDAVILSLDSLSIYKQIDIISAKPTLQERDGILHFGIDEIYPNEEFNAFDFTNLYKKTKEYAINHNKNIVIVGGSGFYLKALLDGLSETFKIDEEIKQKAQKEISFGYELIKQKDEVYAYKISPNDSYRISRWLEIYYQFGLSATEFFAKNPPKSYESEIELFEIKIEKDELKEKISKRTELMIQNGAIDEVAFLESTYTRSPKCMGSIGIKEILGYFDGMYDKQKLKDLISLNTIHLAKRQTTFNKTQFENVQKASVLFKK